MADQRSGNDDAGTPVEPDPVGQDSARSGRTGSDASGTDPAGAEASGATGTGVEAEPPAADSPVTSTGTSKAGRSGRNAKSAGSSGSAGRSAKSAGSSGSAGRSTKSARGTTTGGDTAPSTRAAKSAGSTTSARAAGSTKATGGPGSGGSAAAPSETPPSPTPVAAGAPGPDQSIPGPSRPADGPVPEPAAGPEPGRGQDPAGPAVTGAVPAESPGGEARPATAVPGAWRTAVLDSFRAPNGSVRPLLELAVAEIGPRVRIWADWLHRTYPDPPAHGVARLALRQAQRSALALAAAEVGGAVARPVLFPVTAWVRVTLVLRIAAAYGYDPTDPARAAELAELLEYERSDAAAPPSTNRWARLVGRVGLSRPVLARFGLGGPRAATVLRVALGLRDQDGDLTSLAHRAERRYRPGSAASTDASSASTSSRNSP